MKVNLGKLAEASYDAYAARLGEAETPAWRELGDKARAAWIAGVSTVTGSLASIADLNDEERAIISGAIQYNKAVKDASINRMTVIAKLAAALGICK